MTLIAADRVVETSATTGTGALALGGAITGYKAFSAAMSVGDTCYYMIEAIDATGVPTGDYEVGLGTYSAADTLTRTTVHKSSNANAAVVLAAGTKRVMISATAAYLATLGASAPATPTVRSSNITSSANSTYTITWPTGAVAGDIVLIFAENGFGSVPVAGWRTLNRDLTNTAQGEVIAKKLTAGDITTGSVTVTFVGSFNGVLAAVTLVGTTVGSINRVAAATGAGPSTTITDGVGADSTDLVLGFGAWRNGVTVSFDANWTNLQTINASAASGTLAKYTGTIDAMGAMATITASAGAAFYYALVSIKGV